MTTIAKKTLTNVRTNLQKLYVPEYEVIPAPFFYPNRGRKCAKLPLREKINMQLNDAEDAFFAPDSMEGFAKPIVLTAGIMLQIATLFLYAYFIATTYISNSNVSFISLDSTAGVCVPVPIAVTNSYSFDVNGFWNTESGYNPTLGMYTVHLNNFLHDAAAYKIFMQAARLEFEASLSKKAPSQVRWTSDMPAWMPLNGPPIQSHHLLLLPTHIPYHPYIPYRPYIRSSPRTSSTG